MENPEKQPFYGKTGNRTTFVREKICVRNFLFKCRFQMYFYIFKIQSHSKDMKQMAQVSHNNGVAVKTFANINLRGQKFQFQKKHTLVYIWSKKGKKKM